MFLHKHAAPVYLKQYESSKNTVIYVEIGFLFCSAVLCFSETAKQTDHSTDLKGLNGLMTRSSRCSYSKEQC